MTAAERPSGLRRLLGIAIAVLVAVVGGYLMGSHVESYLFSFGLVVAMRFGDKWVREEKARIDEGWPKKPASRPASPGEPSHVESEARD